MAEHIAQLFENLKALQRDASETYYNPTLDTPAVESDLDMLDDSDVEMDFADVERYLSGDHEQKICQIFDLFPEQFPPAEQLGSVQMKAISKAYRALLSGWSIVVSIPKAVPDAIAHKTLIGTLDREVYLSDYGFVTLEFCSYDPEDCPLAQWCDRGELYWESSDESE